MDASVRQGYLFGLGLAYAMAQTETIEHEVEAEMDEAKGHKDDAEYEQTKVRKYKEVEMRVKRLLDDQ